MLQTTRKSAQDAQTENGKEICRSSLFCAHFRRKEFLMYAIVFGAAKYFHRTAVWDMSWACLFMKPMPNFRCHVELSPEDFRPQIQK